MHTVDFNRLQLQGGKSQTLQKKIKTGQQWLWVLRFKVQFGDVLYSIVHPRMQVIGWYSTNSTIKNENQSSLFRSRLGLMSQFKGSWPRSSHESRMFWCFPETALPTQRYEDEKKDWDRNPRLTSRFIERASVSMTEVSRGKQFPTRDVRFLSPRRRETFRVSLVKQRRLRVRRPVKTTSERKLTTQTHSQDSFIMLSVFNLSKLGGKTS